MRCVARLVACVAFAISTASCNVLETQYFREGIGTSLYTPEGAEVARLQELYVAHICQQAGLSRDGETCADMGIKQKDWMVFAQAGMNDIDRRCDAYLAWLDDKKRTKEPLLKQLLALSGATAGILKAVDAGSTSIALAAIAFNLASDTVTNVSSRLLQSIDSHTVQSVVIDSQQKYRNRVLELKDEVDNGPAAMYLLRGYLRICLPFSIEMSITNTLAVYHRGGAAALDDRPLVTRAPDSTFTTKFAPLNDITTRIRTFWRSNQTSRTAVEDWLKRNGVNVPVTFFLRTASFAADQRRMVRELRIP